MKPIVMLLLVLAGAFIGRPAAADGYDSAIARGVAARDRALETGRTEDWQEALELFQTAMEIKSSKEAKFEFAEAAARLGRDDEAFVAYREALELGLQGKAEERARAFIDSKAASLGALTIEGLPGTRVYVNDRKRAVLPLSRPLVVSPGLLRLHLDPPKFQPWDSEISVESGKTTPVVPRLIPMQESRAGPPPEPHATSRGLVGTGESAARGSSQRTIGIVVGGVGLAGMGASLAVGALAKSQYADADCIGSRCTPAGGVERDKAWEKATIATVVFGVGAVALAGGVTLWLLESDGVEAAANGDARVGIALTAGGLALRGRL